MSGGEARTYTAALLGAGCCPRMGGLADLSAVIAKDFRALAEALGARGFRVSPPEEQSTIGDFTAAQNEAQKIGPHCTHLVVLSCHGVQAESPLLYPSDARPGGGNTFTIEATRWRPGSPTALVVLLIDACRGEAGHAVPAPALLRGGGAGQVLILYASRLRAPAQAVGGLGSLLSQALVGVLQNEAQTLGIDAFCQALQARGDGLFAEWRQACPALEAPQFRRQLSCETAADADDGQLVVCPAKPGTGSSPRRRLRVAQDPRPYLDELISRCSRLTVDVGQTVALEELYIPVSTQVHPDPAGPGGGGRERAQAERLPLEDLLAAGCQRLAVIGDPGSGKSTFLKRVALRLARCWGQIPATDELLGPWAGAFPLLLSVEGLAKHIRENWGQGEHPTERDVPRWIAHHVAAMAKDTGCPLDEDFFVEQLASGTAALLIDGLDEAATGEERQELAHLIRRACGVYDTCRVIVTTRPAGREEAQALPGFTGQTVVDLDDHEITAFFDRWCALGDGQSDPQVLRAAWQQRPDLGRLVRNPLLLTALVRVYASRRKAGAGEPLPEGRADLYEAIVKDLASRREPRQEKAILERLGLLSQVALWMQDHPEGRQVQVARFDAASAVAARLGRGVEQCERELAREELTSGILVGRGAQTRFWHLTAQEYLAARALVYDAERRAGLLSQAARIQAEEWRQTWVLLAGALAAKSHRALASYLDRLLGPGDGEMPLAELAARVGLVGEALADLPADRRNYASERYREACGRAMAVFTREGSQAVPFTHALAAAEAIGRAGDPRFTAEAPARCHPTFEASWVDIPAGPFWMGAQKQDRKGSNYDPEADSNEGPVHQVVLSAYRIGRYPVTVQEYRRFVEAGDYTDQRWWWAGKFGGEQAPEDWEGQQAHPTRPVVGVSWYEAKAYAAWLGQWIPGCRLPTEAEWERAARGLKGRRYPWGDADPTDRHMNYADNVGHITPVGLYPLGSTPEGIADMAGNVWEWCENWYAAYPTTDTIPRSGVDRVVRGGSWDCPAWVCRSAFRFRYQPQYRLRFLGFRLAAGQP